MSTTVKVFLDHEREYEAFAEFCKTMAGLRSVIRADDDARWDTGAAGGLSSTIEADPTPETPKPTTEPAQPEASPKKTRATKRAEPVQPDIEDAVVVEEEKAPEKTAPPTIDDVKEVLKALIAGPGENPAFELLTKYGAKNATTLLETGLAHRAIAEARKLIEEHAAS